MAFEDRRRQLWYTNEISSRLNVLGPYTHPVREIMITGTLPIMPGECFADEIESHFVLFGDTAVQPPVITKNNRVDE